MVYCDIPQIRFFPREFSGEKWWDLGKLTSNMKAGQSSREIINKGRRDFDKGPA